MAETITVTQSESESPQLDQTQIQQAVVFGQMTEAHRQTQVELLTTQEKLNQLEQLYREMENRVSNLATLTISTSQQTERLQEFQTATTSPTEDLESDELVVITPIQEVTEVEVEQTPVKPQRTAIQKFLFGR